MFWDKLLFLLGKIIFFTSSIGGGNSFPKPLSPEKEAECLKRMREGDEEAREILISHNLRLVAHIVKKYQGAESADDLISAGSIGLIKAINTFKSDKNINLATYASRCIENEILMFLRKLTNQKTEISLDEPINTDFDGNELLLSEVLGTEADSVMQPLEEETDRTILRRAVEKLPGREKNIVKLRFGLDGGREQTQKEVADSLGISQSYISRLEKRIIARLRHEILQEIG